MNLKDAPIILDTHLYGYKKVSNDTGRKRARELEAKGEIKIVRTGTGRRWFTVADAERLADAL